MRMVFARFGNLIALLLGFDALSKLTDAPHHAHNLARARKILERNVLPDGILPGPELPRQSVADHDDVRHSLPVFDRKESSLNERDGHRPEVIRRDGAPQRLLSGVLRGPAFKPEIPNAVPAAERKKCDRGGRFDAGERAHFGKNAVRESPVLIFGLIFVSRQKRAERENALRVMAEAVRWGTRGARVNTISPASS